MIGKKTFRELELSYAAAVAKAIGVDAKEVQITCEYTGGSYLYVVKRGLNAEYVAAFHLSPFNGCCGICISHATEVSTPFRGKGIATILQQFKNDIAKKANFTVMICTDVDPNSGTKHIPQSKVLTKTGWKAIFQFRNRKSGNLVNIHVKEVQQ